MITISGIVRRYALIAVPAFSLIMFGCSRTDNEGQNTGATGSAQDTSGTMRRGGLDTSSVTTGRSGDTSGYGTTRRGGETETQQGGENQQMGAAGNEGSSTSDLAQRVRKTLAGDADLAAIDMQNVRITEMNGTITLRGPVRSQSEKDDIESKVRAMAGVNKVDNQLQVTNTEK